MTDLNKNSTLANNPVSSITPVDNLPSENPSKYDEVLNQYSQSKPEETVPESKSNSWTENLPKTEPEIKTESIPETPIETTPIVEPTPQPEITPEPENETFLKPQPEIEVTPEPEFLNKTPDQIKQEISQILDDTSVDSTSTIIPPVKPKINIFQIIFVLSIVMFLIVVSVVAFTYFKSQKNSFTIDDQSSTISDTPTPVSSTTCTLNDKIYKVGESFPSADGCNTCSCSENGSIACTEKACESTSSASKSATPTITSSTKTSFQKLIINWTSYKEITTAERTINFGTTDNEVSFWTDSVKEGDVLYSFTQKLIKGSVKKLTINKTNLTTVLGDYKYVFYLTPNYEKWTNDQFKKSGFIPLSGIGDLSPVYAYSDKLIWSTTLNCGGVKPETTEGQKAQDQCNSLVKEISSTFP